MFKMYKGNIIRIKRSVGDVFTASFTLWYRVGFKIKRELIEVELNSDVTIKDAYNAVKMIIDEYDRIVKF